METPLSPRDKCLGWLEGMKSANNDLFSANWEFYDLLISQLGENLAVRVVMKIKTRQDWRPSPAEMLRVAVQMVSPMPDADTALVEVRAKIKKYGANAARHPENPRIMVPGPPSFTHPIVGLVVTRMGGWQHIIDGDAQFQEGGFDGTFRKVFGRAEQSWHEKVTECIEQRRKPAEYFPEYIPFDEGSLIAAAQDHARSTIPAIPAAPMKPDVPMPARFREMLTRVTASKEMAAK